MKRSAAVEGRFYPGNKDAILQLIEDIEKQDKYDIIPDFKGLVIGGVLPHAGHIYSGHQTIPFFKQLKQSQQIPETIIILNPNHSGYGPALALDPHESWKNALGELYIDQEFNQLLPYPMDSDAQATEHSAEVILPFIQYYFPNENIKILPICIKDQNANSAMKLAENLQNARLLSNRNIIVIASSDFSHFLSPDIAYSSDQLVLDMIKIKNIEGIEEEVRNKHLSICGYGPIMALMSYAELEYKNYKTSILARGHSGEVHPSKEVVDYISILFYSDEDETL